MEVGPLPQALVDIRETAPSVRPLLPPVWCHPTARFLVQPELARRLETAAGQLPDDLRLGFWEGWRPLAVQKQLWDDGVAALRLWHPELSPSERDELLGLLVANPAGVPPHSTGSAVDVTPIDVFGRALPPTDAWGAAAQVVFHRTLAATGLVNYTPEWWHWSYGDEEWARANDCAPLPFAAAPEFEGPGSGI